MDILAEAFPYLKAFGFALPRFLAVFSILPLLSKEALPMMLRIGVIGSFAIFLVPGLLDEASVPRDGLQLGGVILKELFIGVLIGFVLAIPLWALETMGDLCDTQRGASIAQTLNPLSGHETSPLGQLFNQAVVTFLFVIGGFLLIVGAVFDSFRIWPVFGWGLHITPEAPRLLLGLLDKFMGLAVLLAAPVIFCMFLAEAGMALISRFVPQLQVFFLAMPVKSAIAMLVFAIYATVLFDYSNQVLLETIRDVNLTVYGMFTGKRAP